MNHYPKPVSGRCCCTTLLSLCLYLVTAGLCLADTGQEPIIHKGFRELDIEIQVLKKEVLKVNRDLQVLEKEVLYPHGQQLVVFVSMVNDTTFQLKDIRLQLDGQAVAAHTYSRGEETALHEGGVHRVYVGGIRDGEHTLDVEVAGADSQGADFRRQESKTITKEPGTCYIELRIQADPDGRMPDVSILKW
jgi:hypothetical protein